jgi:hypothetical protein
MLAERVPLIFVGWYAVCGAWANNPDMMITRRTLLASVTAEIFTNEGK